MKRVSFKCAKALKEAGYPQEINSNLCSWYNQDGTIHNFLASTESSLHTFYEEGGICTAPYVVEVWLWLWREKRVRILFDDDYVEIPDYSYCEFQKNYTDPEEAIIAAIEHLIDNDLIK